MRRVFGVLGLVALAAISGAAGPVVVSVALSNITGLGTNQATFLAAALTVNGALKLNGSGTPSQAASTDLSDTTMATQWTPADASIGTTVSFVTPTGNYSKSNKTCVGSFRLTYSSTVNTAIAAVTLPCTLANNGNHSIGSCWSTAATPNGTLILLAQANTATASFINLTGAATQPTNANLSTIVVSCDFAFITT